MQHESDWFEKLRKNNAIQLLLGEMTKSNGDIVLISNFFHSIHQFSFYCTNLSIKYFMGSEDLEVGWGWGGTPDSKTVLSVK